DVFRTFGWHANQQLSVLFMYTLYLLFDINGWGWYICFCLLHALNGLLVYKIFLRLLHEFDVAPATLTVVSGVLLFLLSPYHAEVLVWRVCIHYLLSTFSVLFVIWQTLNYLKTQNRKHLLWLQTVFFLSLFTLEITLITPVLILAVVLVWNSTMQKTKPLWSGLAVLTIPQFVFIGIYFLLNKIVLNEWVGHYGAATHFNISFHDIFSNYFRYFIKYLLFARYYDHPLKMKIFGIAESTTGIEVLLSLFILAFFVCIVFYKRLSNRLRLAGLCL